ncbi:ATP-binding response regulator [Piscinibacter terrae]|uniref:histidine kinase n=1 Tax=Piscinibacter terrae TaxID=2496871 RepID=A0A3N7HJH9_9BURK|nr:hybrid sensor histidine kinase/response regulator [Albitalea terrae]RQP22220.1 hybrid sensor histidine kinase/response regulator [Albitalea terrae]
MAPGLADRTDADNAAAREVRIIEKVDALCLKHMLVFARRGFQSLPIVLVIAYLAFQDGAGLWVVAWLAIWMVGQALIRRAAGRLQRRAEAAPAQALRAMTRLFARSGIVAVALMPVFFLRSTDVVLLFVSFLLSTQGGGLVMLASGIQRAWLSYAGPFVVVMIVGWLWRGGAMGYVMAYVMATTVPLSLMSVRAQRKEFTDQVRLLDDNEILSASLKAERDRAEAASASKTRFFAAASHDLRQPLHALSINATTLDLVARRSGDPLLIELSQGIGSALGQSRGLLDGLLDISRLDAHSVSLHTASHDVAALMEAVRNEFAALAKQRGLSLEIDAGPLWVLTDADQLLRILGNLVDNAIKFTPRGGVRLQARHAPDGRVIVSVSDSGPGIAEAERERVFEEFYQVGNPSRDRSQGLGLGLAIVRRTARLLEIPLELVCEPGRGARFELSLPAAAAGAAPPLPPNESGIGRPLSVLMVDDEPDALRSLCTYLREIGWTARGVACGDDAQQILDDGFRADVLVVDFRLRGETGQDVITRLRMRNPGLPAVIVSGDTSAQRLRTFSGLAAVVLHKPIDGARLAQALSETVKASTVSASSEVQRGRDDG